MTRDIASHRLGCFFNVSPLTSHSVITEHRINNNHEFNWDNPEILDKEKYYYRRLISEMINIKSQKNVLNMQSDTELLQQTYVKILNKI